MLSKTTVSQFPLYSVIKIMMKFNSKFEIRLCSKKVANDRRKSQLTNFNQLMTQSIQKV